MKSPTIDKDVLSANLKKLVGGRSMAQVAREIGIGDVSFRSYVSGRQAPSASALKAIADYYNLPISDLLKSEGTTSALDLDMIKEQIMILDAEAKRKLLNWLLEKTWESKNE